MNGELRRAHILEDITHTQKPISATRIAKKYHVSRQIIVGDIALLRASGHDILSTARGYIFPKQASFIQQIAVSHTPEDTERELSLILDHGGSILDVTVEHPVYGQLNGHLNIHTRRDIHDFMNRLKADDTTLLLTLTHGLHLHRIECDNEATFKEIKAALDAAGFLYHND